jgi:hypothetical protein
MENSQYCLVEDCHIKYVDHFDQISGTDPFSNSYIHTNHANRMSGSYNEWKDCSIVYSAGNGIFDVGNYNKVTNCIIHDICYMGIYAGGISAGTNYYSTIVSRGGIYSHNTIHNSGRYAFWHNAVGFECKYNHMYDVGYLTEDLGATYTGWSDGLDTTNGKPGVISYNWVHDNHCTIYPKGIYIDNFSLNYTVHHNLIWNIPESAIILGGDSDNLYAFNNTILASCGHAFSGAADSDCKVINNLHQPIIGWFQHPPNDPELHHNGNYVVNPDGTLMNPSGAIDAGYVIPGITDGYVGLAPDIGCYEYGRPKWTAGANWTEPVW